MNTILTPKPSMEVCQARAQKAMADGLPDVPDRRRVWVKCEMEPDYGINYIIIHNRISGTKRVMILEE
jgi:hypothetical protein